MYRSVLLTRILAVLVVVALVVHWRLVPWFLGGPVSVGGLVFLIYLGLSVAACAGLFLRRRWGFHSFYASVVFGPIMLSVSFIPVPLGFLPAQQRWIGLAVTNVFAIAAGAVAQYWVRADDSQALYQSAA